MSVEVFEAFVPPPAEQAMRQWQLDEPTARVVEARGTYLHVTEVQ